MIKISVCCPSFKRPKVKTFEYLPFCRCYVAEREYKEYLEQNVGYESNIIPVPNEVQGNVCRIRNYIIRKELEEHKNDAVLIVDDDMEGVYYFEDKKTRYRLETEDFMDFLYKYTLMAQDLGVYLWGINVNPDPQNYREYSPFSTTSYIGSPFNVFLRGNELYFDEKLSLKEDYDMTLQQLNKYRKVLRINKFCYNVKQSEQVGGCANYRSLKREEEQLNLLIKKWGSDIVKIDTSDKSHRSTKEKRIDYNPIIKPPIKGI